jgi:carbamoyltransferase
VRTADIDLVAVSGTGDSPPEPAEPGLHHLGIDRAGVLPVDHHLAHAYSAYCLSGLREATVLVVDGAGNNGDTETWYTATPQEVTKAGGNSGSRPRCGGIGATYEAFTNYLGWHEQEAGKTMALAAYGDPDAYPAPLFDAAGATVTGRLSYTRERGVADLAARTGWDFGPPGSRGSDPREADAAAYLQAQTTQALCRLAEGCVASTGLPDLCLADGVALNCVAADQVRRLPAVRGYFAPPAASDRGHGPRLRPLRLAPAHRRDSPPAPGSRQPGPPLHRYGDRAGTAPRPQVRPRGTTASPLHVAAGIRHRRHRRPDDRRRKADRLVPGGSELGPRALGQRSILADPRTTESASTLNARIKHREPFRPFAPAILASHASQWFDLDVPSPFMLLAPPALPGKASEIAAVVHVDGTARVQTVRSSATPRLAALLEEFLRITGVPAVLNTSFNDREPIVETPAHALATFQDCDLDALCIGDYLAEKP